MPRTLRRRLVLATFSLVVVVALVFDAALYVAFELAEDKLFDAHLERDVDSLVALYEVEPSLLAVPNPNFSVYAAENGDRSALPPAVAALRKGADELVVDGIEYHVAVRHGTRTTYFFLFDESAFEAFEHVLFAVMVIATGLIVVVAGLVSGRLARRVIEPLSRLSREVAELEAGGQEPLVTTDLEDDEVGTLTRAIAGYHSRNNQLIEREREFSADVSHELRTPLMVMQGAADVLSRKIGAEDFALLDVVERIRRGCRYMSTLTEALLYLARDPQDFQRRTAPVALLAAVKSQIAEAEHSARQRGVAIELESSEPELKITAIPAIVGIVIGNLLKNAIKHTDDGRVSVVVRGREVLIQDYGRGVDPSLHGRLFERFARGTGDSADGSGIGLALVKRFCDQFGWAIDYHSVPNQGTQFIVRF